MKKIKFISLVSLIAIPGLFSCNSIKADKVTIKGSNKLDIGETTSFTSEVLPKEATSKALNWTSSNPEVAYVDKNGNVTGIKEGKVTISASSSNNVKDSQTILIGGYIETHVSNISLTSSTGKTEIEEGDQIYLNTSISPENADNKNVTFTSSNEEIASVNSYGVVKGEQESSEPVTITAITEDGNIKAEIKIIVKERTSSKRYIKGFAEPELKTHYQNEINNMDDVIDSKQINKDNSNKYMTTNFFKDEPDNQIYKVGTLNNFKYKSIISWGKDEWQDLSDNNPYQTYTFEVKNGDNWVSGNDYLETTNKKNNEFKLSDTAANKIFRLTVAPNKDIYDGVTTNMISTLEFKAIKGYNVYDFAGFTTIDNWTTERAKRICGEEQEVFTKDEFIECWKEFKEEHNIPINTDIDAVILHNNISISSNDLPKYIAWTKHETEDFINGVKDPITKERFNKFVEIKSNIHQDEWKDFSYEAKRAKCRYMLEGSVKDAHIFFRATEDNDFTLEGNFFTVDSSKIKPVIAFNGANFDEYQKIATNRASLITLGPAGDDHIKTSKSGEPRYDYFRPYFEFEQFSQNKYYINNVHFKGDGVKNDTSDEGIGGLNAINQHGFFEMNNCVLNEFSNGVWSAYTKYDEGGSKINKSRFINMFANFLRSSGSKTLEINDSFFADAGGQGILIMEENKISLLKEHQYSNIIANNTYIECFVTGNEIYNKGNIAGVIIEILRSVGLNAIEKYKDLNFGKYPCDHRNFIKIENGQVYVNFVLMHRFNTTPCPILLHSSGLSTFKADNEMILDLPTDSKSGTIFDIYNQLSQLEEYPLGSISFKSSKGGHARLPLYKISEADNLEMYDENINPSGESLSDHTTTLSNYKENQKYFDESIPSVGENLSKLFSGDYCTLYIKPIGCHMFGFVLGYK